MTSTPMLERFKIAKSEEAHEKKKEKKEPESSVGEKALNVAKTIGGGALGYVAHKVSPIPAGIAYYEMQGLDKRLLSKRLLAHQMGAKVDKYQRGEPGAGAGFSSPGNYSLKNFKRTIQLPWGVGESVAAHEMGHNRNSQLLPRAYLGGIMASQRLSNLSVPAASIYAAASSDPSWTPALVSLALSSPVLLDEALASTRATAHMVGKYGLGKGLRHSSVLLPAFGTYLSHALAPLAITGLKKFMKRRSDEKAKDKPQEKHAKLTTQLKPHQQRVVDRMEDEDQPGLVAVHGLGSGKTLTSIAVADALGMRSDVVTPAALQTNYSKELKAHTRNPPKSNLLTLEGVARNKGQGLHNPLLIVDEAHRIRNEGKGRQALKSSPAEKRLALTGSLLYNHPSDIAGPINFAAGKTIFPENPDAFTQKFLQEVPNHRGIWDRLRGVPASYQTRLNPRATGYLQHALDKYVDYHPSSSEDFPTRTDETVKVPMSHQQMDLYDHLTGDQPEWVRRKILENLPPTKSEAKQLNAFLSGVRQISNTTGGFDTRRPPSQPKIEKAVGELQAMLEKNPNAKALVYSHYLESGIDPYKQKLEELHIPHGSFTGEMSRATRDQMVKDYNDNKLKALLLSSAGGEGLDLKGTRLIQLLEPHWNQEKLKQVVGRGIRYKSHSALPEDERNVRVQRFLATRAPQGLSERIGFRKPGYGVDEYLDEMGQRKERLNDQVRQMLREPESD